MPDTELLMLLQHFSNMPGPTRCSSKLSSTEPKRQKGFVYTSIRWSDDNQAIWISIKPHARSRPVCSGCGKKRPGYDTRGERRFEFVPLWGFPVFFLYAMRRVACPACGVVIEKVPWADGKHRSTYSYRIFLAAWAKRLSWKETALIFGTSWDTVYWVVRWGLIHREIGPVEAIGVDEIAYRRGHTYLTLVYQIDADCRRLLYVARDRTEESLRGFFNAVPKTRIANFGFFAEAGTASIGGPPKVDLPHLGIKAGDTELMEVEMCGVYWRVTPAGSLSLTVPDTDYSAELRLVYLDDQVASVWNVTRSEAEVYIRSR
uniref:transposase n=1 Tax=Rhodopirellula baltica TaxID=265606 RepID=UPI001181B1B4|nr:transposase [Rhodopirellula baltica]